MDFKKLKESNLLVEEYIFLLMLYEKVEWNKFSYLLSGEELQQMIENLEKTMYITNSEEGYVLRGKGRELFEVPDKGISFDEFWNNYHTITRLSKTDKEAAKTYWKRLTVKERFKANEMIQAYYDSLNNKIYCRKARTYLENKNFNDEYKQSETKSPYSLAGDS
jgi:hypothetical protein